jgi:hypothetical protein
VIATSIAAGDFRSAAGIRGNTDRFWAGAYLTGPTSGTTHIAAPTATAAGSPGTIGSPGFAEQTGGVARVSYQLLQDPSYSLHIGGDTEFLFNPIGTNTLTLSDRPELRIDPTAIVSTGAIANVAHAQVYSGEAAAGYDRCSFKRSISGTMLNACFGCPRFISMVGTPRAAGPLPAKAANTFRALAPIRASSPAIHSRCRQEGGALGKLPRAIAVST